MSESPGLRRIDAEEVNRLASELDGQEFRIESVDDDSAVGAVSDAPSGLLQGVQESRDGGSLGPLPEGPDVAVGGTVEERAVLREEETS